jgi:hypothetical protein
LNEKNEFEKFEKFKKYFHDEINEFDDNENIILKELEFDLKKNIHDMKNTRDLIQKFKINLIKIPKYLY